MKPTPLGTLWNPQTDVRGWDLLLPALGYTKHTCPLPPSREQLVCSESLVPAGQPEPSSNPEQERVPPFRVQGSLS